MNEDFRDVCDMLDLESAQERAHINAFKTISDQVEADLFGERVFLVDAWSVCANDDFPDTNKLKDWWKSLQLRTFGLLFVWQCIHRVTVLHCTRPTNFEWQNGPA